MANILIAEDEYIIAKGIQMRLEGWGYRVTAIVSSGEEAIASAKLSMPDLVLMDIMLKGEMDGVAVAARIREGFGIPVIYVTAYGSDATVHSARLTNPCGFIVKPFSDETLHSAVRACLYQAEFDQARRYVVSRLEAYSSQLATAGDSECHRLAYELHEEVAELMATLNVKLSTLGRDRRAGKARPIRTMARMIAEQTLERVHLMAKEMYPLQVEVLGLSALLPMYASAQADRAGWVMHIDVPESATRTPPSVELACFCVSQEALTNILFHAKATEVWIELRQRAEELELRIRDNGTGFDAEAALKRTANKGLFDIEQQARHSGGHLEIRTTPGAGTEVRAVFPLGEAATRSSTP